MTAVFNSSPIIFLSKLELMEKVLSLFELIYIPESVIEEILSKKDESSKALVQLLESNKLVKIKGKNRRLFKALNKTLGKGESEVIVCAIENEKESIVILDDYVARKEALKLGLKIKGTLGIIKRLYELGEVPFDLKNLYKRLTHINFRVKEKIFKEIFEEWY